MCKKNKKKTALITGASKRLGKIIAITMAKNGWNVAIHYHHSEKEALRTVQEIKELGCRSMAFQADLSIESETNSLFSDCINKFGFPMCLINNASLFEYDFATDIQYKTFDRHMRTNVAAPLILAKKMYFHHQSLNKIKRPSGIIINLLDQKLINLNPDFLSYTLSKVALSTATTLLAQSFAPVLRVVGLSPGTTLLSENQSKKDLSKIQTMLPLGFSSTPIDIAHAILYLIKAKAMTGTTIYIDGGQHLFPINRDIIFLKEKI